MNDNDKQPAEVMLISIAWAQFIAVSAAVDRSDMRNLQAAWEQITRSPWMWQWDWTKFGGVAVALNAFSVSLLTLPALARNSGWEVFEGRPKITREFLQKLRNMGFYAWLFSFVTFIGYLNFMSVLCLYFAIAVTLGLAHYYRFLNRDPE
jgi:hypothetical protein